MGELREALKARLLHLEEALFGASGQRFEAESEAAAEAAFLDGGAGRVLAHCMLPAPAPSH